MKGSSSCTGQIEVEPDSSVCVCAWGGWKILGHMELLKGRGEK